jgi:hypothetical protein
MENWLEQLINKEGNFKKWTYNCENGLEFECTIHRNTRSGHLCGYVSLTSDNDFFGKDYDDIPVRCHGGLTYASEEGDKWVIGFDCAHYEDLQPFYTDQSIYGGTGTYKNMEFVTEECESICEQISEKSKAQKRTKKINEIL